MITRPLAMAGVLGAAVGVPYVMTEKPDLVGGFLPNSQQQVTQQAESPQVIPATIDTGLYGPGAEVYRAPAPIEGYRGQPLSALLRWDITKEWVYRNWDRKSTGLAELGLFGVRAPIVTGTRMTDIAGTISYYFDNNGLLQKIRLHGTTADTTELVHLAATSFGMQRRSSIQTGNQLFQATEKNNQIRNELRTETQSVLWSTSPHTSFMVDLEVNRPGTSHWVTKRLLPPPQLASLPTAGEQARLNQPPTSNQPEGKPIFPARSIVPDATLQNPSATAPSAEAAAENAAAAAPAASANSSALEPVDVSNDIKPLDSYRDRFRWPN